MAVMYPFLYRSKTYLLVNLMDSKVEEPLFMGNTYVQDNCGALCLWITEDGEGNRVYSEYLFNDNAEHTVKSIIGDVSAIVPDISY